MFPQPSVAECRSQHRTERQLWYVHTEPPYGIVQVAAFSTWDEAAMTGGGPDCYWCPEVGYTAHLGIHLFEDEATAHAKLNEHLNEQVEIIEIALGFKRPDRHNSDGDDDDA